MNLIKIKLNKRLGDYPKGKVLSAELKTHGVVTQDSNGANRILETGEFTVHDVPKGMRIGLRKARELSGQKMMDVGKLIERSRTSMSGYENGDREVQEEIKEAYAKALGMKVDWLEWNADVNKAYYNDTIMKKVKTSSQVDEEVASVAVGLKDEIMKVIKDSLSGLNYEVNRLDDQMMKFHRVQESAYRTLDSEVDKHANNIDDLTKAIEEYNNLPWYKRIFSNINLG